MSASGPDWLGRLFLPGSPEHTLWVHEMQRDVGRPLCKIEDSSSFTQTVFKTVWDSMKDAAIVDRFFKVTTTVADKRSYEYQVLTFITNHSTLYLPSVTGLNQHTLKVNGNSVFVKGCHFCNIWFDKTKCCRGCRLVRYCSEDECQKRDWQNHKLVCPRYDLAKDVD